MDAVSSQVHWMQPEAKIYWMQSQVNSSKVHWMQAQGKVHWMQPEVKFTGGRPR